MKRIKLIAAVLSVTFVMEMIPLSKVRADDNEYNTGLEPIVGYEISDDEAEELLETGGFNRYSHATATNSAYGKYTNDTFYDQMSADEKQLYDNLYAACESALLGNEDLQSLGSYTLVGPAVFNNLTEDQVKNIAFIFMCSNPQFYFLSNGYTYSTGSSGTLSIMCFDEFKTGSARREATNSYFGVVNEIMATVNTGSTPYAKVKLAHDELSRRVDYVHGDFDQSSYSAFVLGQTVCAGYAEAMECLCNAAGVPAIAVTSNAHEWNEIRLNGYWYVVDTTWDDQDWGTIYDYFLKSYATVKGYSDYASLHHTLEAYWTPSGCPDCLYDWPAPNPNPDPDPDPNPDPNPDPDPAPAGSVNMYRLYNPNSGEHFYTSSLGERNNLISLGWNDEGIGWIAPRTSDTPVYRLYNQYGGEHHYTTSIAERNHLISVGWNDEGIGWYSDDEQTVPLYRQYNPNAFANNHNYTTSLSENNWLVSIGWHAEGIGWYGVG